MGVFKRKQDAIAKEIEDLDVKLRTIDPHTQGGEYEQLLKIRDMLVKQEEQEVKTFKLQNEVQKELVDPKPQSWLSKLDPNTVVKVVATFGVAGLIMLFEAKGHAFVSKASGFMPKLL